MPIAKKAYIFTPDGKAVADDGKQTGVILVGKNGSIDEAVAKEHGVELYADGEYEKTLLETEAQNVADLETARKAPFAASVAAAATSTQGADKAAVDSAKQTALASDAPAPDSK